ASSAQSAPAAAITRPIPLTESFVIRSPAASRRDRPPLVAHPRLPVVVPAVPVADLHVGRFDVVESVQIQRHVIAAELLEVPAAEARDAAGLAEVTLRRLAAPLVGGEVTLSGEQRERVGSNDRADLAELRADRAVAGRAGGGVDLRFEFHSAAVTAAEVL